MKPLQKILLLSIALIAFLVTSTVSHGQGIITKPFSQYGTYAGNPDQDSEFVITQPKASSRTFHKLTLATIRQQTPSAIYTSGSTYTIANGVLWLVVNPASTVSSLTITLPPAPGDGQREDISFGGTVSSGTVVTTLVIAANTGQALVQATAPTTATYGQRISYQYNKALAKWYRIL